MSNYTHIQVTTPGNNTQMLENTAKNLEWVKMAYNHGWIVAWEKVK